MMFVRQLMKTFARVITILIERYHHKAHVGIIEVDKNKQAQLAQTG